MTFYQDLIMTLSEPTTCH